MPLLYSDKVPVTSIPGLSSFTTLTPTASPFHGGAKPGRVYYLQQSEDLKKWDYLPVTEIGTSSILSWGFTTTADRLFLRLKHTELLGSPTEMDSDGDSIPDWEEIQENTDPFNQDTDGDGWYDDEEARSNTNPRDEEDKPVLKPMEEYVTVESRWVNASWTQSGGNKAYATWSWSWYSDDPPAGSWVLSSSGEYPVLPVIGGYATFSDGREFAELSGLGEARGKLDELSEAENGWAPSQGPWMVGSSYSEVSQGGDPGYPAETPNYPDLGSSSAEWLVDPSKSWNGGAVELRLAWTPDAPRPERLTQVSVALQSQTIENGVDQQIGPVDLSIQPGEPHSTVGGSTGYGVVLASADVSVPATSTEKKITRYEIVPSEGMRGVIGDVVYSATTGSTLKHFVTPKKNIELPQTDVELEVKGIDSTTFTQKFEWEGGEPGTASNKRKVARDAPKRVILKVKEKNSGAVVCQMYVWVVWAEISVTTSLPKFVDVEPNGDPVSRAGVDWVFDAAISPSFICNSNNDIPHLKGAPVSKVPENGKVHALDGHGYPNPDGKWDMSRQWRSRSFAPNVTRADVGIQKGTSFAGDFPNTGLIHTTTPNANSDHYPDNDVEGNDDSDDPAQNPYELATLLKLSDEDRPRFNIFTSAGNVGNFYSCFRQFKQFARLEIGGKWYRISDFKLMRIHARFKKVSEQALNQILNRDGDTLDELWVDDGTSVAEDNELWQ